MIRAVRSSKAIPISTGRVNRRDAIMTGRFACRGGEREREKSALDRHFGGRRYAEFAACEAYRVSTIGSVADRFIRNSRVGYHADHRVTRLSGQRFFPWREWGKKKMICDEVIYFIYIYIVCFFLARSRVRVLELEFIPRWIWNDSNRINRICM